MDDNDFSRRGRYPAQECSHGVTEMHRCFKGWLKMCRKSGRGIWVRGWREKRRGRELVEVYFGLFKAIRVNEPELGLVDVGGGAGVVDGDVVGGDEAGEVEELVEMALEWKRHHEYHDLSLFTAAQVLARMLVLDIHQVYMLETLSLSLSLSLSCWEK